MAESTVHPDPAYLNLGRGHIPRLVAAAVAAAGDGVVWAPACRPEGWAWSPYARGDEAELEVAVRAWQGAVNTVMSPKAALLPQAETLFAWRSSGNELRLVGEPEERPEGPAGRASATLPAVLLGVRPCDAAAFEVLDQALLEGPWPEESYAARRAGTLIVTWACAAPGPACFCDACGLNPAAEAGDVMVLPPPAGSGGGDLLLRGLTARGCEFLARLGAMPGGDGGDGGDVMAGGDGGDGGPARGGDARAERGGAGHAAGGSPPAAYEERRTQLAGKRTALGRRVDLRSVPGGTEEESLALFSSPAWPGIAERCLSCGACAYVCPTCHCFAISDEAGFDTGRRVRTWDSCGFKEYMVAAGGHNPRPTKVERARQRFMHKLSYHRVRHGRLGCVGCGRCAQSCPVGLSPAEAAARLLEETRK